MKVADAKTLVGGTGKAGKMPCMTYGLRAGSACGVGGKLMSNPKSVCASCYADGRGSYAWGTVKHAQARREATLGRPSGGGWSAWVRAWPVILRRQDFFRWHDSGDVRSYAHLAAIVRVARAVPSCRFWLPTREYALVRKYLAKHGAFPPNLTVRVSAPLVGVAYRDDVWPVPTSSVGSGKGTPCYAQTDAGKAGGGSCGP